MRTSDILKKNTGMEKGGSGGGRVLLFPSVTGKEIGAYQLPGYGMHNSQKERDDNEF